MQNGKKIRNIGMFVAVILFLVMGTMLFYNTKPVSLYKYYEIVSYFENGQVQDYSMNLGTGDLVLNLKDSDRPIYYTVPNVSLFLDDTRDLVKEYNRENPQSPITYDYEPASTTPWWLSLLPSVLLIAVMTGFWFYMMRRAGGGAGGAMNFGKAKVKPEADNGKRVTFQDVAGCDEEKAELEEVVEFLKNPRRFNEIGARIPKGVLLLGPPGTGKTLLARAVSGEAGVPFYSISGSDFVEMFVGVGASRVRDLFEQAKKNAPSIVFIDEIDAVGRHRGAGLGGGHDEREQTLNQLLVEMDGFAGNSGIIVFAATNRRDILDPALLRPGRFDRQILVGYPDMEGRKAILKIHSRNKPLAPDVDLEVIAKTTAGFTGADLENLMNESALLAARKRQKAITMEDIQEATIKVVAGPEKKSHVVSDRDRKTTAYHEAGHAIVTYYCPTQDPVHEISIIPRGMAGGYTMSLPSEDKAYLMKTAMVEGIQVSLGGRVAEQLIFDDISTGASNDIQRATQAARAMVTKYGFSEKLGPILYGSDQDGEVFLGRDFNHTRDYSEAVAFEIDEEIRSIVGKAYEKTEEILKNHLEQLHLVAQFLLEYEKLDGEDFKLLMEGKEDQVREAFIRRKEEKARQEAKREAEAKAAQQRMRPSIPPQSPVPPAPSVQPGPDQLDGQEQPEPVQPGPDTQPQQPSQPSQPEEEDGGPRP